jgi:hypothetical protein
VELMEIATLVFRIGVGVGALLVGIGAVVAALALRPVARDLRSLAADARRLTRLAESELPAASAEAAPTDEASATEKVDRAAAGRATDRGPLGPVQSAHATEDERIA